MSSFADNLQQSMYFIILHYHHWFVICIFRGFHWCLI